MHIDLDVADTGVWDMLACSCLGCDERDDRIQSAAYWLESILQRAEEGQMMGDDFQFDLEELCHVLGVQAPKKKIKYA